MNKKLIGIGFLLIAQFALILDAKKISLIKSYFFLGKKQVADKKAPVKEIQENFKKLYDIQERNKKNVENKKSKCTISNSTYVNSHKRSFFIPGKRTIDPRTEYSLDTPSWICILPDNTVVIRTWLNIDYDYRNPRKEYEEEKERDIYDEKNYYSKIIGVLDEPRFTRIYNFEDTYISEKIVLKLEENELVKYWCKVMRKENTEWKCYKNDRDKDIVTRRVLGIKRYE